MGKREMKELAWLMFALNPHVSSRKMEALFHVYPGIEDWYQDQGKDMEKCLEIPEKERKHYVLTKEWQEKTMAMREKMERLQVKFVSPEHPEYPQRLRHLYDWPKGLFYRGKLPEEGKPSAAIVGARNCSYYGKAAAEKLGCVLAEAGVQIISGLAYGIDAHAHQGALLGKGETFAVMGAGPEASYPRDHNYIYEEILQKGGVLSEQPPGTEVRPYLFPIRNRIISGLSDCVVVIEAREKSGSLITADQALEQGKDVFALPGRMFDDLSAGCNRLIQSGAEIITGPEDLLRYFRIDGKKGKGEAVGDPVLSFLSSEPKYIQEILEYTGGTLSELSSRLLNWELEGVVHQPYPNYYVRDL